MNNTQSLQELFNNRVFHVPNYQRGYAWEKQQVKEFLDDLELLTYARFHYTGTIVLCPPTPATEKTDNEGKIYDNEGKFYVEMDIVDGQQRLTTILLLLNEISRALSVYKDSSVLAQGIRKNYVEATSLDGLPLHKLSLNEDTDNFFKDGVLPETPGVAAPPIIAAQRLLDAKGQIADYLRAERNDVVDGRERWLRDLQSKVTTRLHFNLYEVEELAEVGVIFEVMNDRGKPLTNLEKVKNYLLYTVSTLNVQPKAKIDFTKFVNRKWTDILERLMAAELGSPLDEDRLLRAHWLMQYDPQAKYFDGSKSIKKRFNLRRYQGRTGQLLDELHQFVSGLSAACICYCDALNPDPDAAFQSFSSTPGVRNDVQLWNSKLVRIGVTAPFLPLLMAVRTRWPDDPQKYLEVARLCEVFAFRVYRIARIYANYRQPSMFRLAHDVAHGMEFDDAVRKIKQSYRDGYEEQRFNEFTNIKTPQNWYEERGYLRYFLYEYEEKLASDKGAAPKVKWAEVIGNLKDTVEHVLPQSVENRPYWQERFDTDAHGKYVHDIGNLTLTKYNAFYSNKPFPEKKGAIGADERCYAQAPFFQEQELSQYDDWTAEAINERRAKLLEWAKERWHIDFSNINTVQAGNENDE